MKLFPVTENTDLCYDTETLRFNYCSMTDFIRYLKGVYKNKERFIKRYVDVNLELLQEIKKKYYKDYAIIEDFLQLAVKEFDSIEPFSYKEAHELTEQRFQALVFSSINVPEMIAHLGSKRIKTAGINVKHRTYSKEGTYIGDKENECNYEMHEINSKELGLTEPLYMVKCWCTSTNKEHLLYVDAKYKDDPLEAIASTFHVPENYIGHITGLKRHGDILLIELDSYIEPSEEKVALNKEQYFSLLKAQS